MTARTRSRRRNRLRAVRGLGVVGGAIGAVAAYRNRKISAHEDRMPHVVDRRVPAPGSGASNGKAGRPTGS